ncbi:MAG TPA: YfhO family protein [Haloplasmataceae bacterium]
MGTIGLNLKPIQTNGKQWLKRLSDILLSTPTYKKTLGLILFYVFLFYFPFTLLTLCFHHIVFFQLDHLYQYSSIVFDFQRKLFIGDLSTWDWNNAMGYDYFANFYYISIDFSFLPFLLFPFLPYSSQMWLSFLLKILVGTSIFSYLLKTYGVSNRTNLFVSVLYGTADLFFAQNVFPSFTGIIVYIPLLLLAIEYIIQKKQYILLTVSVFFMFLGSFYWAWPLSLFFAFALFIRLMIENKTLLDTLFIAGKSLIYYLLGLGLSGFLLLPIMGIMLNEPRAGGATELTLSSLFLFNKMVYLKTIYKLIVPNLFAYRGYFYDRTQNYFLPTNHIILYTSILSLYTLIHFLFYPPHLVKRKLEANAFKLYLFLMVTTFLYSFLMLIPAVAMIFSATTTPYLRYYAFFGVILVINLAFFYEHRLISSKLLFITVLGAIGYLFFARYYNDLPEVYSASFHYTEDQINLAFIIAYTLILLVLFLRFNCRTKLSFVLLIERFALIVLIATLMMSPSYSQGVRHHDVYGKEMNRLFKTLNNQDYTITHYFTYYNDVNDLHPFNNLSYLGWKSTYGAGDTFHSLINPYYKPYYEEQHRRLYRVTNTPLFYYLYLDPNQWVISQKDGHPIINHMMDPRSEKIASQTIAELQSTLSIYRKEKELPLGVGFSTYYYIEDDPFYYNYMWLDALYIHDEKQLEKIEALGFKKASLNRRTYLRSVNYSKFTSITCTSNDPDCAPPKDYLPKKIYHVDHFGEYEVNLSPSDGRILFVEYGTRSYEAIRVLLIVDQEDQMYRCYTTFCHIPDTGIKKVIIGSNSEAVPRSSRLWIVDTESLEARYEALRQQGTYNETIEGNRITSYVQNNEPVIMNYKIGYASGWKVWVDGEEVETFPAHGGLLSFILTEPGEHEIILYYETPGLKLGLIISFLSLIIFGLLIVIERYGSLIYHHGKAFYTSYRSSGQKFTFFVKEVLREEPMQEMVRFVIIGGIATTISFLIYQLSLLIFHHNIALTLGYLLSMVFNFFASNRFTFKTTPTIKRGLRFTLAHLSNYLIQLILLNGFILIGLRKGLAIIPTYLLAIPINFFLVRKALKGIKK